MIPDDLPPITRFLLETIAQAQGRSVEALVWERFRETLEDEGGDAYLWANHDALSRFLFDAESVFVLLEGGDAAWNALSATDFTRLDLPTLWKLHEALVPPAELRNDHDTLEGQAGTFAYTRREVEQAIIHAEGGRQIACIGQLDWSAAELTTLLVEVRLGEDWRTVIGAPARQTKPERDA